MAKEYRTITEIAGPLIFVEKTEPVGYNELVEVALPDGRRKRGQVLDSSTNVVVVQIFEGTAGIDRQSSVKFLGERVDVASLLPGIDVFVLSSINEGLPLALLEAMACARPVVATDVGAAAAVVGGGGTGLLVPPKDPDALAGAVTRLLRDTKGSANMGATARRIVAERYNLRATVAAYLALCRGATNGEAGS